MRLPASQAPKIFQWLTPHAWWLAFAGALGFLVWTTHVRIARVAYLSDLASWSVDAPAIDARSPTGYAHRQRRLIVPGHHYPGYEWIMQTQEMLAEGTWRVRHVDYDNAPVGRDTHATAPYRWWLALVAWFDHLSTGHPSGLAVEHGALYADPILHALLLVSATLFAAGLFGPLAASLIAFASVALFPLAGGFQPGAPDEHGLAWICGLWSILPFLAAIRNGADATTGARGAHALPDDRRILRRQFCVAGGIGGLGMWVDAANQWPILAGAALGGIAMAVVARRDSDASPSTNPPWRAWAVSGAATCLMACLVEYFPSHLTWNIQAIHPLHAVAWLGVGELLTRATAWVRPAQFTGHARGGVAVALAVLAMAALPATAMLTEGGRLLADDPLATQLVNRPDGAIAPSVGAWLSRDGLPMMFWAVSLPALIVIAAIMLLAMGQTPRSERRMIALALGPAIAALVLAWFRLRWWNAFDAVGLALLLAATAAVAESGAGQMRRWLWPFAVVSLLVPGLMTQIPRSGWRVGDPLDERDVQAMLERDLAHWLAKQAPDGERPVVFTTPELTASLAFYGGVKGLGTFDRENESGFNASVRIASASTNIEAQLLLGGRGVTHVIIPSWDPMLDHYVRLGRRVPPGAELPANSLIVALRHWRLPPWMQAIPYHIPRVAGFEGLSVAVLKIVGEQEDAVAASRLTDYFVEMKMLDHAAAMRGQLELYPRNLAALVSLAQVEMALGNAAGFSKALDTLLPYVSRRSARSLPFDRRVNLAAALTQGKHRGPARAQIELCLAEMDEPRVRALTTGATVRFLTLCHLFDIHFPDPKLRDLAVSLLPPGLRERLAPRLAPRS